VLIPEIDTPMCVQATISLKNNRKIGISLGIGTYQKGIGGRPAVFQISLEEKGIARKITKLHELPLLINGDHDG